MSPYNPDVVYGHSRDSTTHYWRFKWPLTTWWLLAEGRRDLIRKLEVDRLVQFCAGSMRLDADYVQRRTREYLGVQ